MSPGPGVRQRNGGRHLGLGDGSLPSPRHLKPRLKVPSTNSSTAAIPSHTRMVTANGFDWNQSPERRQRFADSRPLSEDSAESVRPGASSLCPTGNRHRGTGLMQSGEVWEPIRTQTSPGLRAVPASIRRPWPLVRKLAAGLPRPGRPDPAGRRTS